MQKGPRLGLEIFGVDDVTKDTALTGFGMNHPKI
jgi:hypothetical protein